MVKSANQGTGITYKIPLLVEVDGGTTFYRTRGYDIAHILANVGGANVYFYSIFSTNGYIESADLTPKEITVSAIAEDQISNLFDLVLASSGVGTVVSSINGLTGDVEITTGGSVTSVGLELPDIFTVTNSPVTTTGTLTATLANQTQNKVLAAPSGATGTPSFRTLVAADIPSLNYLPITGGTLLGDLTIGINGTGSALTSKNITFQYGDSTAPTEVDLRVDALGVLRFGSGIVVSNATTVGSNLVSTIADSTEIRFIRINANETVSALNASDFRTEIGAGTSSLALGETSSTAYRGDRGKVAYDYSQVGHLPLAGGDLTGNLTMSKVSATNSESRRLRFLSHTALNEIGDVTNEIYSLQTGELTINGDTIYHTGNLNISTKANIASPTFTGTVTIDSNTTTNKIRLYTEKDTANIADTFTDTTTDKSYIYFDQGDGSNDPGYIMHETSEATSPDERNEGVLHLAPSDDNAYGDYVSIHGTNDPDQLKLHTDGTIEGVLNLTASGTVFASNVTSAADLTIGPNGGVNPAASHNLVFSHINASGSQTKNLNVTSGGVLQFNGTNISLAGHTHSDYVAVAGDTMTGDLTMEAVNTSATTSESHRLEFEIRQLDGDVTKGIRVDGGGDLQFGDVDTST